jgi:hypothetical protein
MAIHAANPDKSEQLKAILRCLRACGKPTTATLHEWSGSQAVSTRISELRKRYIINCERKDGVYTYELLGELVGGQP